MLSDDDLATVRQIVRQEMSREHARKWAVGGIGESREMFLPGMAISGESLKEYMTTVGAHSAQAAVDAVRKNLPAKDTP